MIKRITYEVYEASDLSKLAYKQEFNEGIVLFWGEGLLGAIEQWRVSTESFAEPILSISVTVNADFTLALRLPLRATDLSDRMTRFNTFVVQFFGDKNAIKELGAIDRGTERSTI